MPSSRPKHAMSELRWAGPTLVQVRIDKTAVLSIRDTNSLPSKSKWQMNFLNGLKLRFISFALAGIDAATIF